MNRGHMHLLSVLQPGHTGNGRVVRTFSTDVGVVSDRHLLEGLMQPLQVLVERVQDVVDACHRFRRQAAVTQERQLFSSSSTVKLAHSHPGVHVPLTSSPVA